MNFRHNALFLITIVLSMLFACKKSDNPNVDPDITNITYPALYVALGGENRIAVVNLDSQAVQNYIPLSKGSKPYRLTLSPDETKILVTQQGAQNGQYPILVIDATTGMELNAIFVDELCMNATWSLDGKEMWLVLQQSGILNVYDATRGFELKNSIPTDVGAGEINFTFDGVYAVVANPSKNKVHFIHSLTKDIYESVSVGGAPDYTYGSEISLVFTANKASKTFSVVRADNFAVERTVQLGFRPGPMRYTRSDFHLWVVDVDNDQVVRFLKSGTDWLSASTILAGGGPDDMKLTQDNNLIFISNRQSNTVSIINALGQTKIADLPVGKEPCGMEIRE